MKDKKDDFELMLKYSQYLKEKDELKAVINSKKKTAENSKGYTIEKLKSMQQTFIEMKQQLQAKKP